MSAHSPFWGVQEPALPTFPLRRASISLVVLAACLPVDDSDDPDLEQEPLDCGDPDPDSTVGLRAWWEKADTGLTLLAANSSRSTALVDCAGRVIQRWESAWTPGMSVALGPDGTLLRAGKGGVGLNPRFGGLPGAGGIIEQFGWDGELEWLWTVSGPDHLAHHDLHRLPNGHVLALVWEAMTLDEAVGSGRDPAQLNEEGLYVDAIHELDPDTGDIVWRWAAADHLVQDQDPAAPDYGVIASTPARIDINAGASQAADWLHFNGVHHDPTTDWIVVSARSLDEVWVIDHSTTTEEAAGPLGDLLYRWGNPSRWGSPDEQELYGQHDPQWIEPDRLLVFDNGADRPGGEHSRLVEVVVPLDGDVPRLPSLDVAPPAPAWTWTAPDPQEFFATRTSGARRLPGGQTLVTHGPDGRVFELDPSGEVVWDFVSPFVEGGELLDGEEFNPGANALFKARRYPIDGLELGGLDLTPLDDR